MLLSAVLILIYAVLAAMRMIHASGILHNGMLANVLKLPMSFFDTTPLGRVVNRYVISLWLVCDID